MIKRIYKTYFHQLHARLCDGNALKREQTGGKSNRPLSFNTGLEHSFIFFLCFLCAFVFWMSVRRSRNHSKPKSFAPPTPSFSATKTRCPPLSVPCEPHSFMSSGASLLQLSHNERKNAWSPPQLPLLLFGPTLMHSPCAVATPPLSTTPSDCQCL